MFDESALPIGMTVFERGWLSSNNILFVGRDGTALIDSGYHTHSEQTVALVQQALNGQSLDRLFNTHLHSDHCGGNAALQAAFPQSKTFVPPGQAALVRCWDAEALSYLPTGQHCPPFRLDGLLEPGTTLELGNAYWEVHSAPGHDPHSVILFEPSARILISADALWQNGFGIVFPELEGDHAFAEVGATLDLMESLAPRTVVPGHGSMFNNVDAALDLARRRLAGFVENPHKHAQHAAKVLLKFKLLQHQAITYESLLLWAAETTYFHLVRERYFLDREMRGWTVQLIEDLVRTGAARLSGDQIFNA